MEENKRIKAHIRRLVFGPVLILPIIAVFVVVALLVNEKAAKFLVILFAVVLVFCVVWVLLMRRKSYGALIGYSEAISGDVVLQAENLPFPFVISDQEEKILWCNKAFLAMTGRSRGSLTELVPELTALQGDSNGTNKVFSHNGRMYQLGAQTFSVDDTLRAR
ncbi:MAG: PAS domain-containing protein [Lachnospiraceae bacterium]|nr:PAS domain-containing protein [Lachnospiraceae bacterium]